MCVYIFYIYRGAPGITIGYKIQYKIFLKFYQIYKYIFRKTQNLFFVFSIFPTVTSCHVSEKEEKLSQEELEVHQMFGESDSNSTISTPNPGQPPKPNANISQAPQAQAPPAQAPQAPPFDFGKMQSMMEKMNSFMTEIHSSGILEKPSYVSSEYDEDPGYIEIDNELPLNGPNTAQDNGPTRFGVNVNEPQSSRVDATKYSDAPRDENNNISAVPLPSVAPVANPFVSAPTAPVILPDASLPLATDRPPKNWDPDRVFWPGLQQL